MGFEPATFCFAVGHAPPQRGLQTGKQGGKKAVATTKALAMNELYEELETPEGERQTFRIAKARDKATKDFSHMTQIKNEHGVVLTDFPQNTFSLHTPGF